MGKNVSCGQSSAEGKRRTKNCFIKVLKLTPHATKVHTKHTALSFERHSFHMQQRHIHQNSLSSSIFSSTEHHLRISYVFFRLPQTMSTLYVSTSSVLLKNGPSLLLGMTPNQKSPDEHGSFLLKGRASCDSSAQASGQPHGAHTTLR